MAFNLFGAEDNDEGFRQRAGKKWVWGKPEYGILLDTEARQWLGIDDADRGLWKLAYPAVDLDRELAAAMAWCLANPTRGRKSNYRRYLNAWLVNAQDHGGTKNETTTTQRTPTPPTVAPMPAGWAAGRKRRAKDTTP